MPVPTPAKSVQIGEILVPGADLYGARTFMLTRPAGPDPREVELVFGVLAGETHRKIIDSLVERIVEAARGAAFSPEPDPEKRFEAAIKRVNSVILGYLHEQGLSLPGTKLRGAFGLLSGPTLLLAGRGSFHGHVVVPSEKGLAAYEIFEPSNDSTNPKFFAAYQKGPMKPGSRLFVSSTELFTALGRDYVIGRFSDPDPARTTRDLKAALHTTRLPISMISLVMPASPGAEDLEPVRPAVQPRPAAQLRPVSHESVADPGELVSRGVQAAVIGASSGLRALPKTISIVTTGAASAASRSGRIAARAFKVAVSPLRDETGRLSLKKVRTAPSRLAEAGVAGLNAARRHRYLFLLLILLAAGLVNGAIYLARHQAVMSDVRAYEAQLSEIQGLETDLETSLVYGNEPRIQELVGELTTKLNALPEKTAAQKRGKADLQNVVAAALRHLRKEVDLRPAPFVDLGSNLAAPGPVAWWNGKLYAFSTTAPEAVEIKTAGASPIKRRLADISVGVAQTLPATTGLILLLTDEQLGFWNPASPAVVPYAGVTFPAATPLLFYQGRLYHAKPDGSVVRQSVLTGRLGAEIAATLPAGAPAASIAADGSLYLLAANGSVNKLIKGIPASGFQTPVPNPPVTDASALLVEAQGNLLIYLDRNGGRMFVLDKRDGSLIATASDPSLKSLTSWSLDEAGGRLFLEFGSAVSVVHLADLKP